MAMLLHDREQDERELVNASGAERRRGLRIEQHRPIKVLDSMAGRYFGGKTRDVSATGLKIELPMHATVRLGAMLSIHVGLNQTGESLANRRQMIPARVVWIDRTNSSGKMITAGVEFSTTISAQLDAA